MPVDSRSINHTPVETGDTKSPPTRAKILVVDDCEAVARIIRLVLRRIGHEAVTALDGDEAVRLFVSDGPFDLLLTDVILPGSFSGYELAEVLRLRQPSLPVIFFTGYPLETVAKENGFSECVQHLVKPTMISEICDAVLVALET